jgi:hypothetical protein
MLTRLFPPRIDNSFPGIRLGLWLFVPHLALRLLQGINSIVMTERVMVGADGIPLATYPPEAAATAISLFALLGADRLVIGAIGLVALVRYRAMIPLLYVLLLGEFLLKQGVLALRSPARETTAAGALVTGVLVSLMLTGLVLSLWRRRTA